MSYSLFNAFPAVPGRSLGFANYLSPTAFRSRELKQVARESGLFRYADVVVVVVNREPISALDCTTSIGGRRWFQRGSDSWPELS